MQNCSQSKSCIMLVESLNAMTQSGRERGSSISFPNSRISRFYIRTLEEHIFSNIVSPLSTGWAPWNIFFLISDHTGYLGIWVTPNIIRLRVRHLNLRCGFILLPYLLIGTMLYRKDLLILQVEQLCAGSFFRVINGICFECASFL